MNRATARGNKRTNPVLECITNLHPLHFQSGILRHDSRHIEPGPSAIDMTPEIEFSPRCSIPAPGIDRDAIPSRSRPPALGVGVEGVVIGGVREQAERRAGVGVPPV